ncbi:prolyl endopeptidase-like [Diaphorina citri]|uniref:Prolyl endopeptidase n=1 Tax=Diaphorina citri TaxID=121845 RepID=A0A1S3CZ55_DIACI|nr:prolyl endopeptidase-like [Diaphorina citri]
MLYSLVLLCSVVKYSQCVNSEFYNQSEPDASSSMSCESGPHPSEERAEKVEFTGPYPKVRKDETVEDDYHGMKIKDPYRWLEYPHCAETQIFNFMQNNISNPYCQNHTDREAIKEQLLRMANYEKYSAPQRQENNYFYFHNKGLQNHSILYVQRNLTGSTEVFLDPNKLSKDGTTALKLYAFSDNGKHFAYCLSKSGSDWNTLHIKDVDTGKDYPEVLKNVKFPSISWTHDHKGFFYNQYCDINGTADGTETTAHMGQKIYYHVLGTEQDKDIPVVEFPNGRSLGLHSEVTDCGRYLLVSTSNNTQGSDLHYFDLHSLPDGKISGKFPLKTVIPGMDHHHEIIANNGPELIVKTTKNAPKGKVVTINLNNPCEKNWKTLIPEDENRTLDVVAAVANNKLIVHYIQNVRSVMDLHDLNTGKRLHSFPLDLGQITHISGRRKYNEVFYGFTSFLQPGTIYHCNIPENITDQDDFKPTIFRETIVPEFEPTLFQTKQVYFRSKDGTRVPMYIIHRVGALRNRRNPVIIYGYGGYGVSVLPTFSISRCMFLRHFNGIYAIPNIRGGGELGEDWHNAGRLLKKQNCFDDFQAAAEYMINKKYTKPKYITIMGGSNGGLLVGACLNQRPELYGAALILVGALDMLRFNKFTIAYYSESEFGSPNNKTHFHNLLSYSPLHNIKVPPNNTQYPATLVLTGDHDDRVPPLHSYKFIATLQEKIGSLPYQKNPLLLRVEQDAGHGQGTPLMKSIEEMTDIYVFLMKSLGLKYYPDMP